MPFSETDKPPYCVPTMKEIAATPWNGLTVVSTFSGCGGSCLGFKMAGYRVLWASEFVPAAQETYRANHNGTPLDTRDIRTVEASDILAAISSKAVPIKAREVDVLEGSPPCASFSTAGKRAAGWNTVKPYSDTKQRVDDLFFEYARILKGLQPKVFVAENVSGLVKGVAKGYFKLILSALKDCGYHVEARVLDAQWLGVPQQRQRVIFVGVRNDLERAPAFPKPLPYRYSVRDALPWIVGVEGANGFNGHAFQASTVQASTVQASRPLLVEAETDISRYAIGSEWNKLSPGETSKKYFQPTECRKFTIAELKRVCAFPDDFILTGTYAQQWERLGRAVPPLMMRAIAETIRDKILLPRRN